MSIKVRHSAPSQRFETQIDGISAYMTYSFAGDRVYFDHTYVPAEFRGKGIAAALVQAAFEEAQRQHWKVVPSCSYVEAFVRRHPELATTLAD